VNWYDKAGRTTRSVFYGLWCSTVDDKDDDINPEKAGTQDYDDPDAGDIPEPDSSNMYIVTKYAYGYDSTTGEAYADVYDNLAKMTRTLRNDAGQVVTVIENYDNGTVASSDTDKDRTTEYAYNSGGHLETITASNADGSSVESQVTTYIYDPVAHTASPTIHRNDLVWAIIYPDSDDSYNSGGDAGSKFGAGTDSLYDRVEIAYDRLGRRKTVKDQREVVHAYSYDTAARLFTDAVTIPGGSSVDGAIKRIQYGYDDVGRIETVTSYDAAEDGNAKNEVKLTYNGWGAVSKSEQDHAGTVGGGEPAVQYTFEDGEASGEAKYVRLDYLDYPNSRRVYYNYDDSGADAPLTRLDNMASSGSPTDAQKFARYTYWGARDMHDVYYCAADPDVYSPLGPGYGVQDSLGRTYVSYWGTSQDALDLHCYAYDRNSNRTYRSTDSDASGLNWVYTYDGLDRLDDARRGTGGPGTLTTTNRRQNWATLDTLGNWKEFKLDRDGAGGAGNWNLEQSRKHNDVNEIDNDNRHDNAPVSTITASTGQDWVDPVHDAAGNMTTGPVASGAGPLGLEDIPLYFTYDAWNRLVKVQDGQDKVKGEYRFDGLHRRIARIVPYGANWSRIDYYYTRSWQVIEERQADNVITANKENVATTARCQYVWGVRYVDDIVLRDRDTDSDGECDDERLFYLTDANFNVTAVTGTGANVVDRYDYDPYGKVTIYNSDWSATVPWENSRKNEILYCGYRFDPETGLYHVRHRMYHPTLGRWMQRDPSGYRDGLSLYEYVGSQAPSIPDPSGLAGGGRWQKACCVKRLAVTTGFIETRLMIDELPMIYESRLPDPFSPTGFPPPVVVTFRSYTGVFQYVPVSIVAEFAGSGITDSGACCEASCCEYNQQVSGTFQVNGKPVAHRVAGGALLDPTRFREDGLASGFPYGHRDGTQVGQYAPFGDGEKYTARDFPGVKCPPGSWCRADLRFRSVILDVCNGEAEVESKPWEVHLDVSAPEHVEPFWLP